MKYISSYMKQLHSFSGNILYVNLLGMVLISFFEGVAIVLLIPLVKMSGVVEMNVQSIPFLHYFEFMQGLSKALGLPLMLGIYVLLVVGQNMLQRKLSIQKTLIHVGFINHLRLEIYQSFLQAKWDFFLKKRKSDLINALTEEIAEVSNGTSQFLQLVTSIIFTLIQIGIAYWLSPRITLFVLAFGFVLGIFSWKFIKKSRKIGSNLSELGRNYYAGITEHLNGMKEIKSNTLEKIMHDWLTALNKRRVHERMENVKLQTSSQLLYKASLAVTIACFIYFSVHLFHSQPEQLLLIVIIFSRLWPRFTSIQYNMEQIASSIPACTSLHGLQEECKKIREVTAVNQTSEGGNIVKIEYGIEYNQVSYRYNKNDSLYTLQNIDLKIPANCTTAIVGRSGAGKSTLIDILMGLLQPDQGQVCIDGIRITAHNVLNVRQLISYVPQDPFLFNGSIRENLIMIEPGASEEQIWKSLQFAAAEFVYKLPAGIDTVIGDRGIRLSGGERQRLVLARAILKNPSILILDEATSALDTENEAKIQEALDRLKGTMTIIVIAHRLSTIRNADQVIVLDEGKVLEHGGYNQLAKEKRGIFSHLVV